MSKGMEWLDERVERLFQVPLQTESVTPAQTGVIEAALQKAASDPGALFEESVLPTLRHVRSESPAEWARIREKAKAAKVSMADLDRLTHTKPAPADTGGDIFVEVEPWPVPVDGAVLLHEISATVCRHVIADDATIHAATLWIAFTWFIDVVDVAPIANITAPEKRCGKTVLLSVIEKLCYKPLVTSNVSPAALFRAIDLWQPTLVIDEVDAFLRENEEARGILNAGFDRSSAFVIRCTGDEHIPTRFSVWGAKVLCGIGKIADTLRDRSIPLQLRRKLPGENTQKVRRTDKAAFGELRSKLRRFAGDVSQRVKEATPRDIEGLNDRANDCWEPLLAVAQVAGGDWPGIARTAAITLHGLDEETPSIGAELLADIKAVFDQRSFDRIFSEDLLDTLLKDNEAPWASWNRGKPMSIHQLASRLNEFGIKSTKLRIGDAAGRKGFKRCDFEEAWERYLPQAIPSQWSTSPQPSSDAAFEDFAKSTGASGVDDQNSLKVSNGGGCGLVDHVAGDAGHKNPANSASAWTESW